MSARSLVAARRVEVAEPQRDVFRCWIPQRDGWGVEVLNQPLPRRSDCNAGPVSEQNDAIGAVRRARTRLTQVTPAGERGRAISSGSRSPRRTATCCGIYLSQSTLGSSSKSAWPTAARHSPSAKRCFPRPTHRPSTSLSTPTRTTLAIPAGERLSTPGLNRMARLKGPLPAGLARARNRRAGARRRVRRRQPHPSQRLR
jgi:hypothetical protein